MIVFWIIKYFRFFISPPMDKESKFLRFEFILSFVTVFNSFVTVFNFKFIIKLIDLDLKE